MAGCWHMCRQVRLRARVRRVWCTGQGFPQPKGQGFKTSPVVVHLICFTSRLRSSPSLPPPAQLNSPPPYHLCYWSQVLFTSDRNTYVCRQQPLRRLTSVESHCFPDASGCHHHNARRAHRRLQSQASDFPLHLLHRFLSPAVGSVVASPSLVSPVGPPAL